MNVTYNQIRKPRSYWANMTERELNTYVEDIFAFYREYGFPHYNLTIEQRRKSFQSLTSFDCKGLLFNSTIGQSMHALNVAWHYFPHAWEIKCGDSITPMEAFNDDVRFRKLIWKRLELGERINHVGIRKVLQIGVGVKRVSNFRPSAAACIYQHFAGSRATVWDMSSGFGGRLLGALASPNVWHYIGTDPSSKTHEGLIKLRKDFSYTCCFFRSVDLHKIGSEDFEPEPNSLDLCFTSPPYFDNEKYADEPTQSFIRFPTKKQWMRDYLMKTIDSCYKGLKPGKLLIINLADVKSYPNLTKDFSKNMKNTKFKFHGYKDLTLSRFAKTEDEKYRIEPVYIFRKE